ncbi:hypothetical protein PFICI_07002 [Pestalotiopsis fici W106-1]|uniref:Uncharacterized protein n=1 Tax=Pestalotiopsis fici (strain W106-1 / CGMCC3.15140) TaxID=1229662 RepID=W3X7G4_PESFW|nr:uncharacterized protein PFICI_07002 [Pestalotiopsis fici W106-1]ETS82000.1 hypothetical protein PFICI_07002 [Pestalotiopsis fici W106-1]
MVHSRFLKISHASKRYHDPEHARLANLKIAAVLTQWLQIAHEEFAIPNLPPPAPVVIPSSVPHPPPSDSDTENFLPPLPSSPTNPPSTTSSQDTNKENTPLVTRALPQVTSAPAPHVPAPVPLPPGTLPIQIRELLDEITRTLTDTFPANPPHTIQRLAELVLTPKHHYKSLPTYLHALDRVVHVTSGLNVYPLPPAIPDMSTTGGLLSNGVSDGSGPNPFATPGSDEALGGALLTPIPWLQPHGPETNALSPPNSSSSQGDSSTGSDRANSGSGAPDSTPSESPELRTESTETIDGPNGMGSIETVTVTVNGLPNMGTRGVGVTQGELLRQEQRAGVVPVSQLASHLSSHHHHAAAAAAAAQQRSSQAATPSSTAVAAGSAVESGEVVGTVQGADEDEKPHARGPEEIGAEDMGPQPEGASNTNYHVGGPGASLEMQGIDVEAAVGRKATESHSSPEPKVSAESASNGETKDAEESDKMEGVETPSARSATPKREAEDELEGERKKIKEDSSATPADAQQSGADNKTTEAETEDAQKDDSTTSIEKEKGSSVKD